MRLPTKFVQQYPVYTVLVAIVSFLVTLGGLWALVSNKPFLVWAFEQMNLEWKWPVLYRWIAISLGVVSFIFLLVIVVSVLHNSRNKGSEKTNKRVADKTPELAEGYSENQVELSQELDWVFSTRRPRLSGLDDVSFVTEVREKKAIAWVKSETTSNLDDVLVIVSKIQLWSNKHEEFCEPESDFDGIRLGKTKVLPADGTTQAYPIAIVGGQRCWLEGSHPKYSSYYYRKPGLYRLVMTIKSSDGERSEDLFIKWEPNQPPMIVGDPRVYEIKNYDGVTINGIRYTGKIVASEVGHDLFRSIKETDTRSAN